MVQWFVFVDIWKEKQRSKIFDVGKGFWFWFGIFCVSGWFSEMTYILSFVFCENLSDALVIVDLYPVFVPICAKLCVPLKYDVKDAHPWKHRYFLSLVLIVIGLIVYTKPGFIFGYSSDVDGTKQVIGCIFATMTAYITAWYVIGNTLTYSIPTKHVVETQVSPIALTAEEIGSGDRLPLKENDVLNNDIANEDTAGDNSDAVGKDINGSNNYNLGSDGDEHNGFEGGDENFSVLTSDEYILLNEKALLILGVLYSNLVSIIICIIFWPLEEVYSSDKSWFWQEFTLFYSNISSKGLLYLILSSVIWAFEAIAWTLSIFRIQNATLAGIVDISDYFFGLIFSVIWLGQSVNGTDIGGSLILVVAILIGAYPWHKHENIPKWW